MPPRPFNRSIDVRQPLPGWPVFTTIAVENQNSRAYHWDGRTRIGGNWVFQVTLGGEGELTWEGERHRLPPGRGFLFRIDDPRLCYYYPPDVTTTWTFLYFNLQDGSLVESIHQRWGLLHDIPLKSEGIRRFLELRGHGHLALSGRECHLLFSTWANELLAARETPSRHPALHKALNLLDDGRLHLNASELAKQAGCSREHLCRLFEMELAMSPYAFIQKKRLDLALQLVQNTALTMGNIAERCGFASPSLFGSFFKRNTGLTPLQYRRHSGRIHKT